MLTSCRRRLPTAVGQCNHEAAAARGPPAKLEVPCQHHRPEYLSHTDQADTLQGRLHHSHGGGWLTDVPSGGPRQRRAGPDQVNLTFGCAARTCRLCGCTTAACSGMSPCTRCCAERERQHAHRAFNTQLTPLHRSPLDHPKGANETANSLMLRWRAVACYTHQAP